MTILKNTGFEINRALGLCEMPLTISTGEFHYADFVFGRHFTNDVTNGYIQYYHCIKL